MSSFNDIYRTLEQKKKKEEKKNTEKKKNGGWRKFARVKERRRFPRASSASCKTLTVGKLAGLCQVMKSGVRVSATDISASGHHDLLTQTAIEKSASVGSR